MRTKVLSREERRQAIQKEIDAISTDIERVRLLVSNVVRNAEREPGMRPEKELIHAVRHRVPAN